MKNALILIDIQNDYFPGGKMELEGADAAGKAASRLLEWARKEEMPIFHIQHISVMPGSTFFLPETDGVKINGYVSPKNDETVVTKYFPNSFRETVLQDRLKENEITHLVLAGMMSHMCVDATTRAAFDLGYVCTLAGDACATRSLEWNGEIIPASHVHGSFMAALGSVYAKVLTVDEIIS